MIAIADTDNIWIGPVGDHWLGQWVLNLKLTTDRDFELINPMRRYGVPKAQRWP